MKALILVDIQNDFLPGGRLPVPAGDTIIPAVNKLQNYFDLVIASQDWHPSNHKSFASAHKGKNPFENIDLNGLQQTLWPDHCVQGTEGAAFPDRLHMNLVEAIFRKGTNPEIDSYSAFFDNGRLKSTGLAGYLRDRQIKDLYVAGLAGDYCVMYTAMDALEEGFSTWIIDDAVKSLDQQRFVSAVKQFEKKGGRMTTSLELIKE